MNRFEKQLEKWNNGVLRGAQAKLAKILGVSTATTALWTTGKRHPSKGYIARMADLFGMDTLDVIKLFDFRSTTYPEPNAHRFTGTLREQHANEYIYNLDADEETDLSSNSVCLPFLNTIPEDYPQYDESEIIEWWSIPRRYAQGAKYIVRSQDVGLPDAKDPDDLCFVKPGTDIPTGKTALIATQKNICSILKITNNTIKKSLYNTKDYPRVLGTIVRRIQGM